MADRLHIAPCSWFMAKQAVGRWHYSRNMPGVCRWKWGVFLGGEFVGVVLLGVGSSPNLGKQFGLSVDSDTPEAIELLRVAFAPHNTFQTSQAVATAVRLTKQDCRSLRLVVSFADTAKGHHGGIYQAMNWLYLGEKSNIVYRIHGQDVHPKVLHRRYGIGGQSIPWLRKNLDANAERVPTPPKHKYALPLDREIRALITPLSKPYPKRAESIVSDVAANHAEEGGANPTSALDLFGEVA